MKTKSIFFSTSFAFAVLLFLTNCSGSKKEDTSHSSDHTMEEQATESAVTDASAPQFQVEEEFQQQLGDVFTSYIALKDAFVASDAAKVASEASSTTQAVNKVDMKLVTGAAHNDWMAYLAPIQSSLKEMQGSSDIELQRKAFSTLTDNLYKSIKAFGLGGKEAFYEYCPMAFNNSGAYWLSDVEQIRNPYFGDKMLTCGEVKEKLK